MASGRDPLEKLGAVVVTHSRADLAVRCVDTVATRLPRERIVLVANAPPAIRPDQRAALESASTVVEAPFQSGYGANVNRGVAVLPAGLEYVLIANDDVEFGSGSLETLVSALESRPEVAAAGPTFVGPAGRPSLSYGSFPTPLSALAETLVLPQRLFRPLEARLPEPRSGRPSGIEDVDWVLGAAIVVRLAGFQTVGGFDEDFFLYSEEIDLCERLRRRGWTVVSCGEATVLHLGGRSTDSSAHTRLLRRGNRLYLRKRLGRGRWFLLQAAAAAAFAVSAAYVVLSYPFSRGRRTRVARLREIWSLRIFGPA
jgi:N-acetylglucosaminyl-diphospho-decaprenol L-rhamnosyltransferase